MGESTTRTVAIIGTRGYPSFYGGFETAVRFLAPHLADNGYEVTVYSRKDGLVADQGADERVRSVRTWGLRAPWASTLTHGLSATLHAVRTRPDVALVMNPANGLWLPLLRLRGIPTAVNVDGVEWRRAKWNRLGRSLFKLGAWMCSRFATRLIFDAHEIGRIWKDRFGSTGTVIPYGGLEREPLPWPTGAGIAEGTEYVLYVARFVPENSVRPFLEAAEALADRASVVIVGSGGKDDAFEDEVRALLARRPSVTWLGHVADDDLLHALWQHATVYFHGHTVGGTNPALVQAMAVGAPTVATDTVFNREVLGEAGRYVEPDAARIGAVVESLMADPAERQAMGLEGTTRARDRYTWQRVNAAYAALLDELSSSRGGADRARAA